jgi:hypothetical protein
VLTEVFIQVPNMGAVSSTAGKQVQADFERLLLG